MATAEKKAEPIDPLNPEQTEMPSEIKGFKLFAMIMLAVVIVITGAILFHLGKPGSTPAQSFDTDLDALFATIHDDIQSELPKDYKVDVEPWRAQDTTGVTEITVPNYEYKLSSAALHSVKVRPLYPHNGEGSNFTPSVDTAAVHERIGAILNARDFQKGGSSEIRQGTAVKTLYTRDDEVCTLTENHNTYELALVCDSPDLRKQLAEQGKLFIPQYLAKHPSLQANDLTFGPLIVKSRHATGVLHPSENAGYDLAEAVISGPNGTRIALYYQKDGGNWIYVTDTTDEFGFTCGDIRADADARKAMYNQVCYERPDKGPRRLDTNGRATQ